MTVEEWLGEDNQLGIDIWHKKYRYQNETFDEWVNRVSGGDEEVKRIIMERKFLFGGRTLSNRGTGKHGSFSNCYSRGFVEDNLDDIMQANTDIATTFKAQGGQGISLSKLRPKGCGINHGQFQSDGIIPFMEIFNRTTESISQGGSRKGALLLSLDAWHKEAEDFITIKSETGRIQKANLSLEIDDEFMRCVNEYYRTGAVIKKTIHRVYEGNEVEYEVTPINLYKKMMKTAYNWAEPGCIFTDRFRNYNLMQYCDDYQIETCNPCGEQPLPKHGACNLGSINLSEFVHNPFTKDAYFDTSDFVQTVHIAVRGLDEVIDENLDNHALPEQRLMAKNYRNIGLGIMGLHDALIKMGMTYGSEESIDFTNEIMYLMFRSAVVASSNLAKEKGAFPAYNHKLLDSEIICNHFTCDEIVVLGLDAYGLRNCSLLSIAPTGTLGTMLNISTGCEPLFALYYTRKTESLNGGEEKYYKVYSGVVNEYVSKYGEDLPAYFVTSADIDWKDRVDMQSFLQDHVDTAISSTINLPKDITVEEIEQLYLYAWKQGLKGITIFRDGCKRMGVLTHDDKTEDDTNKSKDDSQAVPTTYLKRGDIIECSNNLVGKKRKLTTGCVDCKTEYFNGYEWKPISEYRLEDKVLQYNADGTATLVYPINYIKKPSKGMYHIKTKYGLDMMISPDHRNVTFLNQKRFKIMTTEEIMNVHNSCKYGFQRKFKKSFIYCGKGISLTDDQIRLSIAIFADGCFYSDTSKKVMISVTKQRKRDRLINILNRANIDYSERIDNDGYYNIKFYPPIEGYQKTFPKEWYNCSHHQLEVIFEEVFKWDGYEKKNNQYTTIHKSNADFIQFVCSSLNKSSAIYFDSRDNGTYRVDWSDRILRSFIEYPKKEFQLIQPEDGYDYCFSVPSSMLVLRRNNEIFITGNCGSLHVLAFFDPVTGDMQEVYLNKGSTGGCANYMTGLSRTLSLLCRAGVDVKTIKDQLDSTGVCPSYATRTAIKHDTSKGSCCPMAIGNALVDMWEEMQDDIDLDEEDFVDNTDNNEQDTKISLNSDQFINKSDMICPECGEPLVFEGGCNSCKNCGYSKCN